MYNTYPDWQKQFPFWSVFTVKCIFRRLERMGVLESTQHYNASRWNKTKWYTLNEDVLAELMGSPVVPNAVEPVVAEAEAVETQAVVMGADVAIDEQLSAAIDGIDAATIDGCDFVPSLAVRSPKIDTKSACASEPERGAHTPALETEEPVVTSCHHGAASMPARPSSPEMTVTPAEEASDLDAAYAAIPEAERETWCERADRALEAAGMPDWLRIAPTVREMALRLWVGDT
ncbi:MAG: hypothetical protein K8963_07070, partial [Proteobacteria bacterium]|nr:hypothetical protein [Pseudomonadota bacterium]